MINYIEYLAKYKDFLNGEVINHTHTDHTHTFVPYDWEDKCTTFICLGCNYKKKYINIK